MLRERDAWLATPLNPTRSCIRVLTLHKGVDGQRITCDLSIIDLDTEPYFEVLSYVWGDPKATEDITVGDVAFHATTNLVNFLRYLRSPDQECILWADAICIDQSNEEEKRSQIALMSRIYRQAKEAHIWFGLFDSKTWMSEISGDRNYRSSAEFNATARSHYNSNCMEDLKRYFVTEEGFKPISKAQCAAFKLRCESDLFTTTLEMLDMMAQDDHLYTYPTFSYTYDEHDKIQYHVNESWLLMIDCIRWLLTRKWWSRIWTLQEAVLPKAVPKVHAPPYTFELPRLLNGVQLMVNHNNEKCCKWYGGPTITFSRFQDRDLFGQARTVFSQRDILANSSEGCGIPLSNITSAIQGRQATDIRDHWFGLHGFLPREWQEMSKASSNNHTPAQLFTQFTRLLYLQSGSLTYLDLARRCNIDKLEGLPSWAIDLTSPRQADEEDYARWKLYDCTPKHIYSDTLVWSQLVQPVLEIQAIRVASVQSIADRIAPKNPNASDILPLIQGWHLFYRNTAVPHEENAFWRALFMDTNVQVDWLSRRIKPLMSERLEQIKDWFCNWCRSKDHRDLSMDRKSGGKERGEFHYRAVKRNVTKTRMFITSQGLPGMGPFDSLVGDEVYAFKGCKALVVVRPTAATSGDGFTVVGLCFVDKWMYGRAVQGRARWGTLRLF